MTKACMGGFCAKRAQCPNYTEADRSDEEPSERLCWRGHDGFGPLCELVEDDGSLEGAAA
jgi:hypothetical protein